MSIKVVLIVSLRELRQFIQKNSLMNSLQIWEQFLTKIVAVLVHKEALELLNGRNLINKEVNKCILALASYECFLKILGALLSQNVLNNFGWIIEILHEFLNKGTFDIILLIYHITLRNFIILSIVGLINNRAIGLI